ncbi:uncharacterized protein LOC135634361 [Musa acuminata AAA Group]|uniref:uncharacterized protein LOC135634361 n=1 Tax=Musa acuminata AAA Group TaxID=214697 RepID=UPI0031D8A127
MVGRTKRSLLPPNHLFVLPAMKDLASCFGEHAVKVSDTSCSGSSSSGNSSVIDNATSVLSAVTCVYRTRLSAQQELLIRVTWSKGHVSPTLSVGVDDDPSNPMVHELPLRKKKGSRTCIAGDFVVAVHWDISSAKYGSGPEPSDGFYIVMVVNSELALLLGDMSKDYMRMSEETLPVAEFSMISRREQVIGHAIHSTRARFRDDGSDHEITIKCKGDGWDSRDSELSVSVDKKKVVHVRSLRWNFRGNHTIFIDGSPVDMMWDVHDWWFSSSSGSAVFMFRARSTLDSRLWLEEMLHKEQGTSRFSLLIQAFKG